MQFLLYEFITGGGWLFVAPSERPQGSLLGEGLAMISAVAQDFAAIAGSQVVILWDARLPLPRLFERMHNCRVVLIHSTGEHDEQLGKISATADHSLLIAPEFDGYLERVCVAVTAAGGRLISPGAELVRLASDKQRTAEHLARCGVTVPVGVAVNAGDALPAAFTYPAVLKPRDGAGSQGVRLLPGCPPDDFRASSPSRLEAFVPGVAVSVAAICGPGGNVLLPPCSQRFVGDGDFSYLGGETPLAAELAERATTLARQALAALPLDVGYIGIDMVLGAAGSPDVVIEVNPRLTTSYVGLRELVRENLALAMLQTAAGTPPVLSTHGGKVEFMADGSATRRA
jgi:predicted ATP-grasp superfamily ATP-dependent carboligase